MNLMNVYSVHLTLQANFFNKKASHLTGQSFEKRNGTDKENKGSLPVISKAIIAADQTVSS